MKDMLTFLSKYKSKGVKITLDAACENLVIKGDVQALTAAEKVELKDNKQAIIDFLSAHKQVQAIIPQRAFATGDTFPLSPNQRSIWVQSQLESHAKMYWIPAVYSFDVPGFNWQHFQLAVDMLAEKQAILRTVFASDSGVPFQQLVNIEVERHVAQTDLSADQTAAETLNSEIEKALQEPVDLTQIPAWKLHVYDFGNEQYHFFLKVHHLLADGASLQLLIDQVMNAYACVVAGTEYQSEGIQYADYARWINERSNLAESGQFWKRAFEGYEESFEWTKTVSQADISKTNSVQCVLEPSLAQRLDAFARESRITLTSIYTAAFAIVLSKYGNSTDFVVGIPAESRTHPQLQTVLGDLVNTLPLRMQLDGEASALAFIQKTQQTFIGALEHQLFPFEFVLDAIDYQRTAGRFPLFGAMISFPNNQQLGNKLHRGETTMGQDAMYDLTCTVLQFSEETAFSFEFDASLFSGQTIQAFGRQMMRVLEQLVQPASLLVKDISLLDEVSLERILAPMVETDEVFPSTALDALLDHATQTPDTVAIVSDGIEITYAVLLQRVRQAANHFVNQGVEKGDRIVVALPGSLAQITSMYGSWMAGACYVPIDPSIPSERKQHILAECAPKLVVDEQTTFEPAEATEVVSAGSGDAAYILYTSGSTGTPKGVVITHSSLIRKMVEEHRLFDGELVACVLTKPVFDVSFLETVLPLSTGGRIFIPDAQGANLGEAMAQAGVTILQGTPTYFSHLLGELTSSVAEKLNATLKWMCIGGESLNNTLVQRIKTLLPAVQVNNHYGPTEITIDALVNQDISIFDQNNIGKPFGSTEAFVVDKYGNILPENICGQLLLAGPCIAAGYWNKPASDAFFKSEKTGRNVYATGDLVFQNSSKSFVFAGRKDHQVKYRGYRIELEEINAVVQKAANVIAAHTAVLDDTLVTWAAGKSLDKASILETCHAFLPSYMVPATLIFVAEMPMNANGKIAVDALPLPETASASASFPLTEEQQEILSIWEKTLNAPKVHLHSSFYALGGHSLKLIQLQSAYQEKWGATVGLKALFQAITPAEHLQLVHATKHESLQSIEKAQEQYDYPVSPAQQAIWLISQNPVASAAYNMTNWIEVSPDVNVSMLEEAIAQVVEAHEVLRTVFTLNPALEIRQRIQPFDRANIQLPLLEMSESEALRAIDQDRELPFDLEKGPLFRAKLFHADHKALFYYSVHHIVSDAASMQLLESAVFAQYEQRAKGMSPQIPVSSIQYKDYATWLNGQLQADQFSAHKNHWQARLSGDLQRLELETELARPALKTYGGQALSVTLEAETLNKLNAFAEQENAWLFATLLAAWKVLFFRYTSNRDLIVGTPVSVRDRQELHQQLGYYLNTLPVRTKLDPEHSFNRVCEAIQADVLADLGHRIYPFDQIVADLGLATDPSHSPLFDVFFTLQHLSGEKAESSNAVVYHGAQLSKFDLDINMQRHSDAITCYITYNTAVYERPMVERLLVHYQQLLTNLLAAPDEKIYKVDYLGTADREILTAVPQLQVPELHSIIHQFESQASMAPDQLAVLDANHSMTSSELDTLANTYADYLSANHSIAVNDRVMIQLPHTSEVVAAMLAVKKLGAVYVPVDMETPQERVAYIQQDSQSKAVVDADELIRMKAWKNTGAQFNRGPISPDTVEFIVYTSGSTGNPKGVLITARNIQNRLNWMWNSYPFAENEVCSAKTSVSFVDHIWEIFGALLKGVPLVFFTKEEVLNIPQFIESLSQGKISRLILVPSLLKAVLQYPELCIDKLGKLNLWISSGEALEESLVEQFYATLRRADVRLLNIYGSTELTADATFYDTSELYNPYRQFALFATSPQEEIAEIIDVHDHFLKTHNHGYHQGKGLDFTNVSPESQSDLETYLHFLKDVVVKDVVNVSHPGFIGHMTGPVPAFFRDMNALMTVLNQNMVKIETAGIATNIERQVIGIFHHLVYGFDQPFYDAHTQHPNSSLGISTNGGTLSNISALSYALNAKLAPDADFKGIAEEGLVAALAHYGYKKVVVLGSKWCHYSIGKALKIMGLGKQSFVELEYDNKTEAEIISDVSQLIGKLKDEQVLILGLIAVAGTTEGGMVEPLDFLGSIAAQHQVHFHVDAAFGGSFLVDEVLRTKLKGIERADTVTICAHKQFYLPIGLSFCLFKHPDFAHASENNTHYQARKNSYDLGKFTIEGSRNFMSLLLHATFQVFGKEGFAHVVRNNYKNAQTFAKLVSEDPAFELMYQPDLNIVLYRYVPFRLRGKINWTAEEVEAINVVNQQIQQQQFEVGNTFVSYTNIKSNSGHRLSWFRTVFMNPYSTTRDFIQVLEDQKRIAAEMEDTRYTPASISLKKHVPIGKSLQNVQAYILDEFGQLVPVGVPGEICFAGDCVTTGYLNLEDQTSERYIDNPFGEGTLFKTGDIGKWMPDGNISYIGRRDHQVKIRGYRIELDEISIKTRLIPGVEDALIHTQENNGDLEIVAYLVGSSIDLVAVKESWTRMLPHYMVPARVAVLEAFALTSSGKIDRKKLPVITDSLEEVVAPQTDTEHTVHAMWKEVLGDKEFGITNDFFQLGGHSLNVVQLLTRYQHEFGRQISITDLFQSRTIAQHVRLIGQAPVFESTEIPLAPELEHYPISPNQQGIWALSLSKSASIAYNMCYAVVLKGDADLPLLKDVLLALAMRHEVLRTSFHTDPSGEITQRVHASVIPSDFLFDAGLTDEQTTDELLASLYETAHDFSQPCQWKVLLAKRSENELLFGLNIHHIISDGWSIDILMRDIFQLYKEMGGKASRALQPLRLQYKDISFWQQQRQSANAARDRAYWLERFDGDIPLLELPAQHSRPAIKTYNGADVSGRLDASVTQKLTKVCQDGQATLFMGLMALVQGFLYKYTGQKKLVIGAPVSGRNAVELEEQIGYYVKTLAFVQEIDPGSNATALLNAAKTTILEGIEHADFTFDELVKALQPAVDLSRSPLFDVMLVIKNENQSATALQTSVSGLEIHPVESENRSAKYDITFVFNEINNQLIFSLEYNTELFTAEFMQGMCNSLVVFADQFFDEAKPALKEASLLDAQARQELEAFNQTAEPVDLSDALGNQLWRSFDRNPEKNALLFENQSVKYREVQEKVAQTAAWFQQNGIVAGSHVGVFIHRSEWSVYTMLAIYALGAVYIPVDAALPDERVHFILKDAATSLVVTDALTTGRLDNLEMRQVQVSTLESCSDVDVKFPSAVDPETISYIIYTSGSTGNPKGVAQTYKMLQNLMHWNLHHSGLKHQQKFLSFASFGFDSSLNDILYCLLSDGTLYLVNEAGRHDFNQLRTWILDEKIETVSMPYSALKAFFEEFDAEKLKGHAIQAVISTGEQLFISGGLRHFLLEHPQIVLHNFYGPSETHVVTASSFKGADEMPVKALIGKPLSNTYIRILDADMNAVPVGVHGQLYIGGWNLANGYYGNPAMTGEKFISDPFLPGALIYTSGDSARWMPSGEIEYLQRIDGQIKIRGFRVEIGEIETKLNDLEGVDSAVVHFLSLSEQVSGLAAYYLSAAGVIEEEVRTRLKRMLPDYMVPSWIYALDKFPITVNGKVDKRALPKPDAGFQQFTAVYVPAENDLQQFLVDLWQELFGAAQIGIDDNFFELGGHSLLAVRILNRIQMNYDIKLDLKDIYLQPTIRNVAAQIQMDQWLVEGSTAEENMEDMENFTF